MDQFGSFWAHSPANGLLPTTPVHNPCQTSLQRVSPSKGETKQTLAVAQHFQPQGLAALHEWIRSLSNVIAIW